MKYIKALQISILATLVALSSCTTSGLEYNETDLIFKNKQSLDIEVVREGVNPNLDLEAQNKVIQNKNQFEAFWNELHDKALLPSEIPEINFEQNMLLVTVLGRRGNGGISVQIDKVVTFKDMLAVRIKQISPKNCAVPTVMTNPFFVAKIEKSELPVKFFVEKQFRDCSE